jgi:adenylate cyclase
MLKLYDQFADQVRSEMKHGLQRKSMEKSLNESLDRSTNRFNKAISGVPSDEVLFDSLAPLGNVSTMQAKFREKPGAHPDFLYIGENGSTEEHAITSMFIDISRSTGLFRKYKPQTVADITTTIQKAALFTCWHFGGYIQRFHGDGLLVYFGGRSISLKDSTSNALNAASFFTYFVKNILKDLFDEQGVEKIYTRIGIDAGENEDVLWHKAGIGDCSEITTCSLHTSLAAHMQGEATGNGIMVGDHVKQFSAIEEYLFSIKKDNQDNEHRYIYDIPEENFHYTQWIFNWEGHLKNNPLFRNEQAGPSVITSSPSLINSNKNLDYLREQTAGYKPYFHE